MSESSTRRAELSAFFAAHAQHVQTRVARRARAAPEVVDDACATAWSQLVRRADVELGPRGVVWLITVAIHEAWRLQQRRTQETPLGPYARPSMHDDDPLEPIDAIAVDVETQAVDRAQHPADVEAFLTLKPRERQTLYLHALGYRYAEICELTGFTYTAVNRYITEGRRALRRGGYTLDERARRARWAAAIGLDR
jgi:DNA-directed RNA polymerase specialized sigma24 family protein